MTSFDNRNTVSNSECGDQISTPTESTLSGQPHYVLKIDNKKIVYCYTRKNACSAFKRLFLKFSHNKPEEGQSALLFMHKFHKLESIADVETADHTVFVYRDPVERIVSLFVNKFITKRGHQDIFPSFHEETNIQPEEASFKDFVFNYLMDDLHTLDPHVIPQIDHLHRIFYSDAIYIKELYTEMKAILGNEIATKYFKTRVNSNMAVRSGIGYAAEGISAGELGKIYSAKKLLPDYRELLTPEIESCINRIYSLDKEMFEDLHESRN